MSTLFHPQQRSRTSLLVLWALQPGLSCGAWSKWLKVCCLQNPLNLSSAIFRADKQSKRRISSNRHSAREYVCKNQQCSSRFSRCLAKFAGFRLYRWNLHWRISFIIFWWSSRIWGNGRICQDCWCLLRIRSVWSRSMGSCRNSWPQKPGDAERFFSCCLWNLPWDLSRRGLFRFGPSWTCFCSWSAQ